MCPGILKSHSRPELMIKIVLKCKLQMCMTLAIESLMGAKPLRLEMTNDKVVLWLLDGSSLKETGSFWTSSSLTT